PGLRDWRLSPCSRIRQCGRMGRHDERPFRPYCFIEGRQNGYGTAADPSHPTEGRMDQQGHTLLDAKRTQIVDERCNGSRSTILCSLSDRLYLTHAVSPAASDRLFVRDCHASMTRSSNGSSSLFWMRPRLSSHS